MKAVTQAVLSGKSNLSQNTGAARSQPERDKNPSACALDKAQAMT